MSNYIFLLMAALGLAVSLGGWPKEPTFKSVFLAIMVWPAGLLIMLMIAILSFLEAVSFVWLRK